MNENQSGGPPSASIVWLDMTIVRFHCPFVGLNGCHDGGGNGLTKTSLITHFRDRHCNGFFCVTPDSGDGVVQFVLYDLTKPQVPSCSKQLIHVEDLLHDEYGGFTLVLFDSLFSKGLRTVKSIPLECRLGFSRVLKGALDKEESIANAIQSWSVPGGSLQLVRETLAEPSPQWSDIDEEGIDLSECNIKQCKKKICDGHYTAAVRVFSSLSVAPYNNDTLKDLKAKHRFKLAPSLPHISNDHHRLIASPTVVLDRIKSFPHGTSCGRDGLRAQHLMDFLSGAVVAISDELVSFITQVVNLFLDGNCPKILGEYIASAPLTPLVKKRGGIRPIAVGTVWRRMVSKVSAVLIGHSLDGYFDDLKFGVGVSRGGEAILYVVNRLIEGRGDDLYCTTGNTPYGHAKGCNRAWYLDDGTIIGDTLVVGKVLELIIEDGPSCVCISTSIKLRFFWPKEDPRSRLAGVFPSNIVGPLHGVKLLGGPASVDFNFSNELVMKRVAKTIVLMEKIAKINDPYYEFLLLHACAGISKLYFAMRTSSPQVFEMAQCSFDTALRSALERIVTAYGPGFGDWQWDLPPYPLHLGGLASIVWLYDSLKWRITLQRLRVVLISRLGQTMNGIFMETMLYHVPGISAGKEVDIGLGEGCDKPLHPADMLLYSWDEGLDVCVDLTGSSSLTQTKMVDFVSGRAVIDAAHRKRVKYEAKCANIRYGFLPFSFSSLGELKKDAVNLLKWI
nr:hypothetical protein [Tanacetum cinerariifolium]